MDERSKVFLKVKYLKIHNNFECMSASIGGSGCTEMSKFKKFDKLRLKLFIFQ